MFWTFALALVCTGAARAENRPQTLFQPKPTQKIATKQNRWHQQKKNADQMPNLNKSMLLVRTAVIES